MLDKTRRLERLVKEIKVIKPSLILAFLNKDEDGNIYSIDFRLSHGKEQLSVIRSYMNEKEAIEAFETVSKIYPAYMSNVYDGAEAVLIHNDIPRGNDYGKA